MAETDSISAIPSRRISAVRGSTRDIIEFVLNADIFLEDSLALLARREEYPEAAQCLRRLVTPWTKAGNVNILQALIDSPPLDIKINRIACAVGLLSSGENKNGGWKLKGTTETISLTYGSIHKLANGNTEHAAKAALVLALLGELTVPWIEASKEVRAGYLLGRLVEKMRNDLR